MSISVLIVAHNEEKYIKRCLDSIKNQTKKPDEVMLIAHNCSDDTVKIAKEFSFVKVIEYSGPDGTIYARIKGFELVTGDIVACIDGDSYASSKWLDYITTPLHDRSITGTGGMVWFFHGFIKNIWSISFFFLDRYFRPTYHFYFWGANFACRAEDYRKVGGLTPLIKLKDELGLHLLPDDAYLSCALSKIGKVLFVPSAEVTAHLKYNGISATRLAKYQDEDRLTLFSYFGFLKPTASKKTLK
ncbi:MAG: glycosyltransferase family 2 protein [Patescibacteria group bacterium]